MKFARLLLESYSKLNEQGEDVIGAIKAAAGGLGQGDGTRNTITPPNGGNAGQVGLNDKGEPFIEGGPMKGFEKANVMTADQKTITTLQNWWAGEGAAESEKEGVIGRPGLLGEWDTEHPTLAGLSEKDIEQALSIEEVIPGTIEHLKNLYSNSLELIEDYTENGRKHRELSELKLRQKVFGGMSRGSLAWNLKQEIDGGFIKFERTKTIGYGLEDIDISELTGSLDMMSKLSNAYVKSKNCKDLDVDLQEEIKDGVRKDPKHNTYFFVAPVDDKRYGVSLSVADWNPINLMAKKYNENVENCRKDKDSEDYTIPEKDIKANHSDDGGNISNIVKDSSENIQIAAFHLLKGNYEQATEIITELASTWGSQAFNVLKMKKAAEEGDHVLNEKYGEMIDFIEDLNIEIADDIKQAIGNTLKTFMISSAEFISKLNPDYAVRVGGSAGKGDKSDVDYIFNELPKDLPSNLASNIVEIDFEKLSKEAKEEIKKSGKPIQEKYFTLGDSLKSYVTEGYVKLGQAGSLGTECSRLIDPNDNHGNAVWNGVLEGMDPKYAEKAKEEGTAVLTNMKTVSEKLHSIMTEFKTPSMSETQVRKFVSEQIKGILTANTGTPGLGKGDLSQTKLINKVMEDYKKNGTSGKALGEIDRAIQLAILKKSMTIKNGKINKAESIGGLAAFAAIQASVGMDSTGNNPISHINILETGNKYVHDQNKMILEPLKDLLDVKSSRTLSMGVSSWRVSGDGSTAFHPGRSGGGGAGAYSYINTHHLTPTKN